MTKAGWMRPLTAMLLAALVGCATAPTSVVTPNDYGDTPTPEGVRRAVLEHLKMSLRDADSLKDLVISPPHRECYSKGLLNGGGLVCAHKVCVGYNAKNSFGAYVGTSVLVFWFRGDSPEGGVFENAGVCPPYIEPKYDWKSEESLPDDSQTPDSESSDCTDDARRKLRERGMTEQAIADICGA